MESVRIVQGIVFGRTIVESERLLIQIPKQVERLNRNVGSMQTALEQRPKILKAVGVDSTIHVLLCMVDNLMFVLLIQSPIAVQFVGKNRRASLHVLLYRALKCLAAPVWDDASANLAATFKDSHYSGLVGH